VIGPNQSGECRIRVNIDDKLIAVTHGYPCSIHIDPVEKKPLFHFLPGTSILSLATVGCNLHCKNCQNWEISQKNPEDSTAVHLPPEQIPLAAKKHKCKSVAYTYTDPVVYYEYALESSIKVREAGLKNVLVTAGYINQEPWRELCKVTDAANIDIKAMDDQFYRDICDASLKPVLDAVVHAKAVGVTVEITNLVIPTLNDSDKHFTDLCRWIVQNTGADTPLHFSRFHPQYRMRHLPPTSAATLDRAREIAKSEGLQFVYIGNILRPDAQHTYCPSCGELLIKRQRYNVSENHIKGGKCGFCQAEVYGTWM